MSEKQYLKDAVLLAAAGNLSEARAVIAKAPPGVVVVEVNNTVPTSSPVWSYPGQYLPVGGCVMPLPDKDRCSMTMVTLVGGRRICWLHAIELGLDVPAPSE